MKKITDVIVDEKSIPVYYVPCKERRIMFEAGNRACVACAFAKEKQMVLVFDEFYQMPHKDYIIMHEIGHIMSYPDCSEEAANAWALLNSGIENANQKMVENYAITPKIQKETTETLKRLGFPF